MHKVTVKSGPAAKNVVLALKKRGVDANQENGEIVSNSDSSEIHRALRDYRNTRVSMGYPKFHWTVAR